MKSYQVSSTRQRFSCAAAAVLASTLVLTSVLWLFDSVGSPAADAPSVAAQHQQTSPGA
jgi:hypothetical protein